MYSRIVFGLALGFLAVVGFGGTGRARDAADNPTGTWKWTTEGKDGQKRETVLKLKADGGKLTGTVSGFGKGKEDAIEEGTVKGNEVRFNVTRMFKDNKVTTKYTAKVTGDVMKGTAETTFGEKSFKKDFEAKRDK